jgi:ABC-2 type transport system ATP-binding protein
LHQQNKAQVDEKLAGISEFFNGEIINKGKYIRDLSKGNQCKVGVGACLLQQPELLMLDEPFANIDPSTQFRLKNILKDQNKNHGVTTIVSSHDLKPRNGCLRAHFANGKRCGDKRYRYKLVYLI